MIVMKKVIVYGTFDLFHYGHDDILKKAKECGNHLTVAVNTNKYDESRGKNNFQKTKKRMLNVENSHYANRLIMREYIGQEVEDIDKYDIDVVIAGKNHKGEFDHLKNKCQILYLDIVDGISTSQIKKQLKNKKRRK